MVVIAADLSTEEALPSTGHSLEGFCCVYHVLVLHLTVSSLSVAIVIFVPGRVDAVGLMR